MPCVSEEDRRFQAGKGCVDAPLKQKCKTNLPARRQASNKGAPKAKIVKLLIFFLFFIIVIIKEKKFCFCFSWTLSLGHFQAQLKEVVFCFQNAGRGSIKSVAILYKRVRGGCSKKGASFIITSTSIQSTKLFFKMSSKESCRNELRTAIRQLSDRCLYSASKW